MVIVETSIFTHRIKAILDDDEYRLLQQTLADRPTSGVVIPHSGGLRKIRWGIEGRGKRGGIRVIYYSQTEDHKIYMVYVFAKTEQSDLTHQQLTTLRLLIAEDTA